MEAELVCSECGGNMIFEWMIGWFPKLHDDHSHDPNRKRCEDCGHVWFAECPVEGCEYAKEKLERYRSGV